jgi:hypothetical protein
MAIILNNTSFILRNSSFLSLNPSVVSLTNLILSLDATNVTSYPGSGTTWFDISGYGNNASLTAATASNGAVNFNRTTNTRAIVSTLNLSTTNAITINMWVKINTLPAGGGDTFRFLAELSENYNTYSDSFFTAIATEVSTNRWFTQDKGDAGYNAKNLSTPLPVTGSWYNFTVIYDHTQAASSERTFYINGVNQTSIASTEGGTTFNSDNTNNFGNRPLYIGGRSTTAAGLLSSDMDLGVFQVYNTALNATQVSQSYESYKTNYVSDLITSGSVLYLDASKKGSYRGTGSIWNDLSGYENTATLVNGPVFSGSNSISFDGTNDYAAIETSASLNLAASSFTVSQVIKVTNFTNTEAASLMWEAVRGGNNFEPISIRYSWFTTPAASVTLVVFNTAGTSIEITSTFSLSTNTLYNIVGTYEGTVARLYINGTLNNFVSSSIIVGTPNADARWIIGAGEINTTRWFNGNIYNTIVYNRALSAGEVSSNYAIQQAKYGI